MSLNVRPLSEDLKRIACTELNEVESRLPEEIKKFREWILMQPHLKARTNDQFLLAFLRGSKHSLEKAKSKIEHYYAIRSMVPEIFKNVSFPMIKDLLSAGIVIVPPRPSHVPGPEICITRLHDNFDGNRFKLIDVLRLRGFASEYALQENDNCIVNGFIEIFDSNKVRLSLYAQADIILHKKITVFFEKGIPVRLKSIHIVNFPKEGRDILLLIRSMLTEKYKKRFFVHKTLDDLHKHVPREALPVEYGGTNGTVAEIAASHARDLDEFANSYEGSDQYGVDESLRPHKKIDERSLFGLEGSFRKLDID